MNGCYSGNLNYVLIAESNQIKRRCQGMVGAINHQPKPKVVGMEVGLTLKNKNKTLTVHKT